MKLCQSICACKLGHAALLCSLETKYTCSAGVSLSFCAGGEWGFSAGLF